MLYRLKILNWLSGLPLTLVGLVFFLAGILPVVTGNMTATQALAPGYILLVINLVFSILVREKIRRNPNLLVFHLVLLLMLVSIGVSRVTFFKGWVQIAEEEVLTKPSGIISEGVFHSNRLGQSPIQLLGFRANFEETGRRTDTQSYLQIQNQQDPILINNAETANISGYQFTISNNVGFAAEFTWMSNQGEFVQTRAHFPSQIAYPETQGLEMMFPGMKQPVWVGLEIQSERISFFYPFFKVPEKYYLSFDFKDSQIELMPGSSVELVGGNLSFHRLSPWIGYELYYDPAIYFLLIASLIGVLSLALFLWQKQSTSSWNMEEKNE